ncbi:F0F1 ATP synthase subunit A [Ilyomonas limi]|uniref:ATP synthase subunit a n=1 Tax=Ilyomonas limi TaxID=2575867 RepID=A0A4U3L114_9BACT|nr:F0F1 ATP synthase subunit A [Ilyomonas limi]TKK68658.1 F0F1 ATP synthase subunit A [Ilyomonas limi]
MGFKSLKLFLVAAFSVFLVLFSHFANAQEPLDTKKTAKEGAFDPAKIILEHVMDAHEFHFFSYKGSDGEEHEISIPLPVILYSPQRGLSAFSYARFHDHDSHGIYNGYKNEEGKIVAVDANGNTDETVKVYDLSLTRNVVQMFIALILLVWILLTAASKYRKHGTNVAPTGIQNLIEPVVTFIRDEVGRPNLGVKYEKYMPYLLTVFFFILFNTLVGLIPGTANVTGNIAFTMVLAVISLIVIVFSTNRHFWGHIFWPPGVPIPVKLILIPIEVVSTLVIKPGALMIRLFANMIAGHIVITCFILLIFIFGAMNQAVGWGFIPVSVAFTIFLYFIEILVAFIQAFIFTNLTAVFIGQAFEGEHHDGHDHAEDPVII